MRFNSVRRYFSVLFVLALFLTGPLTQQAYSAPSQQATLFLDAAWYRENLIKAADLWNGGLDGQSGMGTYQDDFNGFFPRQYGSGVEPIAHAKQYQCGPKSGHLYEY